MVVVCNKCWQTFVTVALKSFFLIRHVEKILCWCYIVLTLAVCNTCWQTYVTMALKASFLIWHVEEVLCWVSLLANEHGSVTMYNYKVHSCMQSLLKEEIHPSIHTQHHRILNCYDFFQNSSFRVYSTRMIQY